MARRVSMFALAALLVSGTGCRTRCGDRGWFTSATRGEAPCNLVGRPGEVCCDGMAGVPVSNGVAGPAVPGTFVPGPAVIPGGRPDELPMPQPSDLIPRPGVPVPSAVPTPAPPDGAVGTLPLPKAGVPVRGGK